MDSYLDIAEEVLLHAHVPLSPREILSHAYSADIVPAHLYGKTQHKTLQARLSEDILSKKDRSAFYRTEPGRFFLRKLMSDPDLSDDFKVEFSARRRVKDLEALDALAIYDSDLEGHGIHSLSHNISEVLSILQSGHFKYIPEKSFLNSKIFRKLISFVIVMKGTYILTYRKGKYVSQSHDLAPKRSVGFTSCVTASDNDLFENSSFGIINSGVKELTDDLGLTPDLAFDARYRGMMHLKAFINTEGPNELRHQVGAVILYDCPDHFEPTKKRLAINDLRWMNLSERPNNMGDFETWSRLVIEEYFRDNSFFMGT